MTEETDGNMFQIICLADAYKIFTQNKTTNQQRYIISTGQTGIPTYFFRSLHEQLVAKLMQ